MPLLDGGLDGLAVAAPRRHAAAEQINRIKRPLPRMAPAPISPPRIHLAPMFHSCSVLSMPQPWPDPRDNDPEKPKPLRDFLVYLAAALIGAGMLANLARAILSG